MRIAATACCLILSLASFASCKGGGSPMGGSVVPSPPPPGDEVHPAHAQADPTSGPETFDSGLSGEQLLEQGLDKKARGDLLTAQRLFDRARRVLEAKASGRSMLEPMSGLWEVSAMAWAPDGTKLAVAAGAHIHVLADQPDGEHEVLRLQVDAPPVAGLAFSPDSKTLAASSADGGIALWNLQSGSRTGRIQADQGAVQTLTFNPDGQLLGGRNWQNPEIQLWSSATGAHVRTLEARFRDRQPGLRGGSGEVGQRPAMVGFSPDGKEVLGTYDGTLAVWSLSSDANTIARVFKGKPSQQGDAPIAVAYHPDGRLVASGSEAGEIIVWEAAKGTAIARVKAHELRPVVAYSRDGTSLVSVAEDGIVRRFAARSLAPIASSDAKTTDSATMPKTISAVALALDGSKAAMAGEGALVVRDVSSGKLTRLREPGPALSALAVSPNIDSLAMGTSAGSVLVLSVSTGSLVALTGHTGEVTSLAFAKDGTSLVSASRDKTVRAWKVGSWTGGPIMVHPQSVNGVAFRPDGRTVATACDDGQVRLWDATTGAEVVALPAGRCAVFSVAFSVDGAMVLANTADRSVLRWNVATHAPLARVERPFSCSGELRSWPNSLAPSADGKLVVSAPSGGEVELWSVQTGSLQGTLTESRKTLHVRSVAVSPTDPITVAAAGDRADVWRLTDRDQLPPLAAPDGVDTLAFSADGRFLFGASHRGVVSVWSMHSGRLEVSLRLHSTSSATVVSSSGLVEWLGAGKPPVACRLRERLYPAELCQSRYLASGLLRSVLSGQKLEPRGD